MVKFSTRNTKEQILIWLKEPKNIILSILLTAVTILGIIEGNLLITGVVFIGVYIYARILGFLFDLIEKYFN